MRITPKTSIPCEDSFLIHRKVTVSSSLSQTNSPLKNPIYHDPYLTDMALDLILRYHATLHFKTACLVGLPKPSSPHSRQKQFISFFPFVSFPPFISSQPQKSSVPQARLQSVIFIFIFVYAVTFSLSLFLSFFLSFFRCIHRILLSFFRHLHFHSLIISNLNR